MIEQVVNMKKRYQALVKKFTIEDFEGYFAEFFAQHSCVRGVLWSQEAGPQGIKVSQPEFDLTPAYSFKHPFLDGDMSERELFETYKVRKNHKEEAPELYEAVTDIQKLFEASDVFEQVFGSDVDITAHPKTGVTVTKW